MAIVPTQLARVSNLLRTNLAHSTVSRTQQDLLKVQNELSTGRRIHVASDDPGDAAVAQQLQKSLEQRDAYMTNLNRAQNHLSEVDSTLGDLGDLLKRAQTIASANVGSDVTEDMRKSAAAVVDSIFNEALSLGNKQYENVYIFGGDRSTEAPFVSEGTGVRFVGSSRVLENIYDENTHRPFMVDGAEIFGALSTRVEGTADLTPSISAATRLTDLRGAADNGIRKGVIRIGNGSTTADVDLNGADTVGDVIDAINAAGVGTVTASIAPDGVSIRLSGGLTEGITVQDIAGGTAASDLGILQTTGGGAGIALDGSHVKARVTPLTPLANLKQGAGIDTTSGMVITNGNLTATIDLSGATTVEDMLNALNSSAAKVRAEINETGTGIRIVNPVQGSEMRISENGGTTAADLGVRSFDPQTPVGVLNGGKGVRTVDDADFRITASDGTFFDVNLAGETTIQDVITKINAAATTAGVAVAAGFNGTTNGITLTDTAGGGGTVHAEALNFSDALKDLGLDEPAGGTVITGRDVAPVSAPGIFADLMKLRDALDANDQAGITRAAEGLTHDESTVIRVRGRAGAQLQELESRHGRLEDQNVATRALLSEISDVDFTDAITRFETLQTALQASLQTGARVLNLSLLDFLG